MNNKKYLNKIVNSIMVVSGVCIGITSVVFVYDVFKTSYNTELLNNIKENIIYTKRDEGEVYSLYMSKGNLDKEVLLLKAEDLNGVEQSIYNFKYDSRKNVVISEICDTTDGDNPVWITYETNICNLKTKVKQVGKKYLEDNLENNDYRQVVSKDKRVRAETKDGDLYVYKNNELLYMKEFKGMYDNKLCSGFVPVSISDNNKYLVFRGSKHKTPIGEMAEDILFSGDRENIYVLNLNTKEESQYVNSDDVKFVEGAK